MDNNTNAPQDFLKNIFKNVDGFINAVENGEGMNLTEEQKKQFKEKFEQEGGNDLLRQVKEKKEQLFKQGK